VLGGAGRAVIVALALGAMDRVEGWTATRDEIRVAILTHGWSERAGAFTQAFDSDELDASSLLLAIVGFLSASDPRMKATLAAVASRLTDDRGLVYRYRTPGSGATVLRESGVSQAGRS
jgi:GH15 family glucan-1,4-alpha-glucosidase